MAKTIVEIEKFPPTQRVSKLLLDDTRQYLLTQHQVRDNLFQNVKGSSIAAATVAMNGKAMATQCGSFLSTVTTAALASGSLALHRGADGR